MVFNLYFSLLSQNDELSKPIGSETEFIFIRLTVLREYLTRELQMSNLSFAGDDHIEVRLRCNCCGYTYKVLFFNLSHWYTSSLFLPYLLCDLESYRWLGPHVFLCGKWLSSSSAVSFYKVCEIFFYFVNVGMNKYSAISFLLFESHIKIYIAQGIIYRFQRRCDWQACEIV